MERNGIKLRFNSFGISFVGVSTIVRWGSAISLAVLLAACGGGGGGDGGKPGNGDNTSGAGPVPGGDTPQLGAEGLTRMYYDTSSDAIALDPTTGQMVRIPGESGLWPSKDGTELVTVDYSERSDGISRLVIRSHDGHVLSQFAVSKTLHGVAKLSPDKQLIAVFWSDEENGESYTDPTLTVFTRSGTIVTRLADAESYDWMPDGRILYSNGPDLFVTDQPWTQATRIVRLDQHPYDLAVSPDGTRLAFTLAGTGTHPGHVWLMNMDGTGVRALTTSSMNERNPVWSPDGTQIALRHSVVSTLEGYAGCPDLYVLSADAPLTDLSVPPETGATRMTYLKDTDDTAYTVCPFSVVGWAPAPVLQITPGTLPTRGAGVNPQLPGTLYFGVGFLDEDKQTLSMPVESGLTSRMPDVIRGVYASPDALSFAVSSWDWSDAEDDYVSTLDILDSAGTVRQHQQALGMIGGMLRFSNSGRLLAFNFDNPKRGYASKNNVVVLRDDTLAASYPGFSTYDFAGDQTLWLAKDDGLYAAALKADGAADGTPRLMLPLKGIDWPLDLRVSPDGTRVAFSLAGRLWIVNADGTGMQRLTRSGGAERAPEWSPDSRYIAFDFYPEPDRSFSYTWVVAADAQNILVGTPERHSGGISLRRVNEGGDAIRLITTSYLSWR